MLAVCVPVAAPRDRVAAVAGSRPLSQANRAGRGSRVGAAVQRLDLLFGWIPQLARMAYFFHPIAHLAAFRVRLESELACDGWAMAETGHGAGAYADLLVRLW